MVAYRKHLIEMLSAEPRTASSLARELGLDRREIEQDLQHLIRSARAAGHNIIIEPARCKACGFLFERAKLTKPGKCPSCRATRIFEPLIRIAPRQ
jgi:predicted Zn-ribbon and HTH transcriptional regulator